MEFLSLLMGTGLAASAGLNAYIPLLSVGLLARFTDVISLPGGWTWLENGWTLGILGVLLGVEIVADKVPAIDSLNDVLHTAIRPTAGGLAFGATAGAETVAVSEPSGFMDKNQWIAIVSGVVISFVVHAAKALLRPVINVFSGGLGGPVISFAEDAISLITSLIAILIPILVVGIIGGFVWAIWALLRRRSQRRAVRRNASATAS